MLHDIFKLPEMQVRSKNHRLKVRFEYKRFRLDKKFQINRTAIVICNS